MEVVNLDILVQVAGLPMPGPISAPTLLFQIALLPIQVLLATFRLSVNVLCRIAHSILAWPGSFELDFSEFRVKSSS